MSAICLQPGKSEENLELLARGNLLSAPPNCCITSEVYKKTPLFGGGGNREGIEKWTTHLGIPAIILTFVGRLTWGTYQCILPKHEELDKKFFPVVSGCLASAVQGLGQPISRTVSIFTISSTALMGLSLFLMGRIFRSEQRDTSRFLLLEKEYSNMAKTLEELVRNARKAKDICALKKHRSLATRLLINLPVIKTLLTKTAKIPPASAQRLTEKLSRAAHRALKGTMMNGVSQ